MLQMNIIEKSRQAVISYPREMHKPTKIITVNNWEDVERKWMTETRDFVYSTLRSWTIHRNNAFKAVRNLSPQRSYAVDRILLMLINHQNSNLPTLCRAVLRQGKDFVNIMPGEHSSNYAYACKVIAPMLAWCEEYVNEINQSK